MGATTGSGSAQRLFVAVELPAEVESSIEAAIVPWKAALPRARWIPSERRHLTLCFLGSTEAGRVPWIEDRLADAGSRRHPFVVGLHGLGAFPSSGRARVLWIGLDDPDGSVDGIAGDVRRAIATDFPPDPRPFSAHVTVARCDPPVALPMPEGAAALEIGPLAVREMCLMRSHLGSEPRYETLARVPLGVERPVSD